MDSLYIVMPAYNEEWKKMLDKNRKLPEKTFSEYIKKFHEV